jgi:hypothetical protein
MSTAEFNDQNNLIAEIIRLEAAGDTDKALESLSDLMKKPETSLLAMMDVLAATAEGSPVRQKAAANVLSLSYSFNDTPDRVAQACWLAAKNLPAQSPAGEAALDRVLDLAGKGLSRPELSLAFVFIATERAVPHSIVEEKGRDEWLKILKKTDDERQKTEEIKAAARHAPPGSALQETAISLWRDIVCDFIEQNNLDDALTEILDIAADPATKGLLEAEANRLWQAVIEGYKADSLNSAVLKASRTSDRLYQSDRNPGECAVIKQIVAETLLDLSQEVTNPGVTYQLVIKAADYAGDDVILHQRIVSSLYKIARDSPKWEHQQGAGMKLQPHVNFIRQCQGRPPLPAL